MFIPVFAFFKRIVCCSQASFESVPVFFKWLAGNRLRAVPNGVDIARIDRILKNYAETQKYTENSKKVTVENMEITQKQDDRHDFFTLIAVGRLIAIKNPLSVLSVFYKSATLLSHLQFIGEGEFYDDISIKCRELNIERQVELIGLIPREEVYKKLSKADLFISTSRGEGLPVATLEAMTCCCPVLLSDIAPHREIAGSVNFIPLIEPDDIEGFVREIRRFQQLSVSEKYEIGKKCRKLVEERFSLAAMHKGYETIYDQIIVNLDSGKMSPCRLN